METKEYKDDYTIDSKHFECDMFFMLGRLIKDISIIDPDIPEATKREIYNTVKNELRKVYTFPSDMNEFWKDYRWDC